MLLGSTSHSSASLTKDGLTTAADADGLSLEGLTPEFLIQALRLMVTSRRIDDREILLKRQNRVYFQVSAAGHEAIQVATGLHIRPGKDWLYPYYRDRALCLTLGVSAHDMLLGSVGAADDPASGGRQMPSHWSSPNLHIVTASSPTGSQFVQAMGCASGGRYIEPSSDEVTVVCTGDGATSEGEFWEMMNILCLEKLPVLVLVEDNNYAISVPIERQTAGGSISALLSGFPNLLRIEVDGTDFIRSYRAVGQAMDYIRSGRGPAIVHAHCIRPYSHSLSDDEVLYKSAAERKAEAARDPLSTFPDFLMANGILHPATWSRMNREIETEVQDATDLALKALPPPSGSAMQYLYSERVDPTSNDFDTPARSSGDPRTMVDSINLTLHEEMQRDPRVVVFGEDVADCSREEVLREVKGKGGVFKATHGLQSNFGSRRCFNSTLAEAAIVGRAIGMATRGLKPVAEIQFFDYIWPAMMQLRDEMANIRWRSNNGFSCPAVIRVPIGGYLTGGAVYHSQCGESIFTHIPGLRVVFPSNSQDASGLLRTAIRCDDPVLFLEHKKLYRELYNRAPHPGSEYLIPFGKARLVKPGKSLTIVTYGALVQKSLQAATLIEQKSPDTSIEILDLRTLAPYDWEAIRLSVTKTNRVMIAHEDTISWGYGAEIAARIANELFTSLDAPVGRVAAKDTWVAYHPMLENEILPQTEDLVREAERLLVF
jgi:2-oxoisovalerate dehydrogenase E1 component